VLRLHFTHEDVLRTTLAPVPNPTWELMLSVRLLRRTGPATRLGRWRAEAYPRFGPHLRPLLDLVPVGGAHLPDFLTPPGVSDLDSGVDRVLSTPRAQLRAELLPMLRAGLVPDRVTGLWRDGEAVHRLGATIRRYHAEFVAGEWAGLTARIDADRTRRVHQLAAGGVERLLATLHPQLGWDSATLTYRCDPSVTVDLPLDGRGLLLQPSVYADEPALLLPADGQPTLVYPVPLDPAPHPHPGAGQAVAQLLGRTRAAVLAAVGDGATTTQLAHRVGVSIASASQHAGVLRSAGLITTVRTGPAVRHALTRLGAELLGPGHPFGRM
jgi:DNA-binding transcriptional ArsR family regulator